MIRLKRAPAPQVLFEQRAEVAYRQAEAFFYRDDRSARQRRFQFDDELLEDGELYTALRKTSKGRCSFCTIPDRPGAELSAHRLRPPQDAVAADGRSSRRHYWWLAYEWSNLLLACKDCRTAQGSKFPTESRRVRVGTYENLAEHELPYLIDPAGEDPEPHFVYLDTGEVVWRDERGLVTVETFDLNRPRLVTERREQIERTREEIREAAAMLGYEAFQDFLNAFLDLYSTEPPFAALRRQFFNQWVQFRFRKVEAALEAVTGGDLTLPMVVGDELPRITNRVKWNLSRLVSPQAETAKPAIVEMQPAEILSDARIEPERIVVPIAEPAYIENREIHTVEISNFQGLENLELRVAGGAGEGSWLMLLGENGAGKTAALKAIALTLMPPEDSQRVVPDPANVLRQGESEGQVRVQMTGTRKARTLRFSARHPRLHLSGAGVPALLAGYGPTRLLPSDYEAAEPPSGPSTGSLFDPRFPLSRPSDWIPELSGEQFDAVARGLHTILRLGEGEVVRRHKRYGLEIDSPRGRFGLAQLSEGYKTMAALALDMMRLFLGHWGHFEAAEGVVLIDEIGAHLHPRWQMKVVSTLRRTFPRVQFIATTHDPLCLRGLQDGEVVVLRRLNGRLIVEQDDLPSIAALSVDQLLTSEHFGLYSALDPEVEAKFERYYELLAARQRSASEGRELQDLRAGLADKKQLGRTRREQLALEAVDEHLAQERWAESAGDLRALPEEARHSVRELLARVGGT